MATAKLSEVVSELTDQLTNNGDQDIYFVPEETPGSPGDPITIQNFINRYESGNPHPTLGVCITLG